ncbi:MAG: holo-ACP synthase [Buchnera aphidicola (Meitanaphis flavogallis)]
MSIIGIGIDILSITRIKKIMHKLEEKFLYQILSNYELNEYKKSKNPIVFLAKRFSVKEAASKALGTGIKHGVKFNNFELYHNHLGKPSLRLLKKAKKIAKNLNINSIHVSLSDEKSHVSTIVIIEK